MLFSKIFGHNAEPRTQSETYELHLGFRRVRHALIVRIDE